MMKIWKKVNQLFFAAVDWPELINGVLLILVGLVFDHYYGYKIEWSNFLNICMWYLFFKIAIYCLEMILSGEIARSLEIDELSNLSLPELRILTTNYFWIISVMFLAVSFLPLFQINNRGGLTILSFSVISCIYVGELVLLIKNIQKLLSGLSEVIYAFITAFLLPALYFSLTKDYLKSSIILVSFPLFLQLIAWRISNNLELKIRKKRISTASLVERIGTPDSLYAVTALIVVSCLTLFLDIDLSSLLYKAVVLVIGLLTAILIIKSIKKQQPNWQRALFLIRLLPMLTAFSILVTSWMN